MEHSATPWRVTCAWPEETPRIKIKDNGCIAIKSDTKAIGLFGHSANDEAQANAAFIVRACNSHNELVAGLKHAVEIAEGKIDGNWDDLLQYRAALAKAGGRP